MNKKSIIASIIGFLIVAILIHLSDISKIVQNIGQVGLIAFLIVLVLAILKTVSRSLVLNSVLNGMNMKQSYQDTIIAFYAIKFSNNVTPFGDAGAEPVAAHFVRKLKNIDSYEKALAAVTSSDIVNQLTPNFLIVAGLIGIAVTDFTANTKVFVIPLIAGLLIAGFLLTLLFKFEYIGSKLEKYIPQIFSFLRKHLGWDRIPSNDDLNERIQNFSDSFDTLSNNKKFMVFAIAFSTLGVLLNASILLIVITALGSTISVFALFLIIPIHGASDISPTPGGLGSSETVLAGLLVLIGGMQLSVATATVVLVRSVNFIIPTVVGWASATYLQNT